MGWACPGLLIGRITIAQYEYAVKQNKNKVWRQHQQLLYIKEEIIKRN